MSRTEAVSSLTRKNKVGLGLAAFLGLADTTNLFFMIPQGNSDTPGPPAAVLIADGVLGIITVAAVVYAWRLTSWTASRVVAGARILSVITALPALFVTGVPAWVVAVAALFVVVSVVVIGLVLSRPAPEPVAA
ncbi:hypothetical protein [Streptomyces mirabilis]|uniref:hypothetical protein n=1 Tax=Streptomyces mirabilis TaxID=68239 RepID=UPI003822EC87